MSRDFHKSIELINLTVTMYMVMQGLCACIPRFTIETVSHWSLPRKRNSSDGLGNAVRPSGAQASYDYMPSDSLFVLCRAGPSPNVRLLAVDGLTMFPSGGISKHLRHWYVSSSRTMLVGRTNSWYYHHQVLGSLPTSPRRLNELASSGFSALALWYVLITPRSK